jgi:hypothetical protein
MNRQQGYPKENDIIKHQFINIKKQLAHEKETV